MPMSTKAGSSIFQQHCRCLSCVVTGQTSPPITHRRDWQCYWNIENPVRKRVCWFRKILHKMTRLQNGRKNLSGSTLFFLTVFFMFPLSCLCCNEKSSHYNRLFYFMLILLLSIFTIFCMSSLVSLPYFFLAVFKFHLSMFLTALVHEFHIFYSHTEWYLLVSQNGGG